jgi:hypothetical protein
MKKSSIILLTLCYFIVATGFAINIHYCGGKLKEISLTQSEDCCCGSKKKAKGCCEEKTVICKIKDNQKTTGKTVLPTISKREIVALYVLTNFLTHPSGDALAITPDEPPPPNPYSDPVFLLNRNFRI